MPAVRRRAGRRSAGWPPALPSSNCATTRVLCLARARRSGAHHQSPDRGAPLPRNLAAGWPTPADGELLFRDYSTGVFVDLAGRPAAPRAEMMGAICGRYAAR